jgi:hypothetical protein
MRSIEHLEREQDRAEFLLNASLFADAASAIDRQLRERGMGPVMRFMVVCEWIRGYWRLVSVSGDDEE